MPGNNDAPKRGTDGQAILDGSLTDLLRRNGEWTRTLPENAFEDVRETQRPWAVSVCCADSRVSQEGMFRASEVGSLFTPSNIGNTVVKVVDGERVIDGNFHYGLESLDTPSGIVVGHTGCGAVTLAHAIATGEKDERDVPPGVVQEIALLVEIVEEALESGAIDTDAEEGRVVNQLVEYNVNAQIDFLRESEDVSDERDLYGFVYDFQTAYGDVDGRAVLVNVDGETGPDALRKDVPEGFEDFVGSLLD